MIGVVTAALAALAMVLALLVVDVARIAAARAQVATAADAAALAAAPVTFSPFGTSGDPVREAAVVAVANGATLVACNCFLDGSWSTRRVVVTVEMQVSSIMFGDKSLSATSAAEFRPVAPFRRTTV